MRVVSLQVIVATVWMHDASPCYMMFGMLGAMSASFITWVPHRPATPTDSHVSLLFVPCTVLSLVAVHYLPRSLSSVDDFSFWLKLLHVLLVLPQVVSYVAPTCVPKVSGAALYRLLALLIVLEHWFDPFLTPEYAMPVSDCQISITCDLVFCSLITVYAIYVDTGKSTAQAGMALVLLPFVPPGVVLALHLSRQQLTEGSAGLHSSWVTWLQEIFARRRASFDPASDTRILWMNLGQGWANKDVSYVTACKKLASTLGNHIFKTGDGVLACGCGYGAELLFWKETFDLAHITGIDTNPSASQLFPPTSDVRLLPISVDSICQAFQNKIEFNRIVALDSVYHFEDKFRFFADCAKLLPAKGSVGVTDLILSGPSGEIPFWMSLILRAMHVNVKSLWTSDQYRRYLGEQGWVNVQVKPFEAVSVLAGWFPDALLQHVQYAVVSADRPPSPSEATIVKPKVAIVGSGLSGLVAAHELAGTHDVTIFEANERGGLSGKGEMVHGQVVDIPLRIIGEGYYSTVEEIARRLHVRLEPIREDNLTQTHYADTKKTFSYSHSYVKNFFSLVPYISELLSFRSNLYSSTKDVRSTECETWGDWMSRHGYATKMYQSNAEEGIVERGVDSYLMWLFMGQASWMLSCTYQAVLDYPAYILLDFFKSLGVGADVSDTLLSSGSQSGRMLRIKPSMEALEFALRYGIKIRYDTRVCDVGRDKVIKGEKFDVIVMATEASAIKHVLSNDVYSPVFSDVQYQASSIYLHTDHTLLPVDRSAWKAFNICQDSEENMCMLTAWLNQYYANSTFTRDVFQTWNPHVLPAEADTLKVVHFQRVVHSADTPRILAEVAKLQGINGFYYVGAYSVDGMGLLEQAAVSGIQVAARIRAHE